jgi:hypothetical protein
MGSLQSGNWNHLFGRKISNFDQDYKELLALREHQSSPPVFSGVRVTRSLDLGVCFVDRWLSLCTFSFDHCAVCSSSIDGFWLPLCRLWYLQTLLTQIEEKEQILLLLVLFWQSEEEQTTQWPKAKGQKDKQRSTKHTHKTKDWVTRTPLKTEGEHRCSGRVSISCSTSDTRHVNLVTNPIRISLIDICC